MVFSSDYVQRQTDHGIVVLNIIGYFGQLVRGPHTHQCAKKPAAELRAMTTEVAAGVDLEATFSWSSLSTFVFIFVLLQLNKGGTSLLTSLVLDLREALVRISRGTIKGIGLPEESKSQFECPEVGGLGEWIDDCSNVTV